MKAINLSKPELETLRHALYIHREMVRTQNRLAMDENTEKSRRDSDRFGKIISHSLKLDDKLSEALNEPQP